MIHRLNDIMMMLNIYYITKRFIMHSHKIQGSLEIVMLCVYCVTLYSSRRRNKLLLIELMFTLILRRIAIESSG